jgi:hypothetical protein
VDRWRDRPCRWRNRCRALVVRQNWSPNSAHPLYYTVILLYTLTPTRTLYPYAFYVTPTRTLLNSIRDVTKEAAAALLASRRTADDQGSSSDNVSQGIFIINFPTIVVALLSFLALSFAILGWHSVSSAIYGIALGIALLARAAHEVMTVSP